MTSQSQIFTYFAEHRTTDNKMAKAEASPTTTYKHCYSAAFYTPPPFKYHQIPALVHKGIQQYPPRKFPVQPRGPQRILDLDPEGPVLGLGTKNVDPEKYLDPKPIVKSAPPSRIQSSLSSKSDKPDGRRTRADRLPRESKSRVFETKFGPMDSKLVDKLVHKYKWTSTTTQAAGEACLEVKELKPPETTLEQKADMVRLNGRKYENEDAEWQRAIFWDCLQTRGSVKHDDLKERAYSEPEKLLHKRKRISQPKRVNTGKIRQLLRQDELSNIYVKQCPGYAGFVPRAPPEGRMERRHENPQMVSTMKATYRPLPPAEYQAQLYARKGPLSKTVTLTYPFNPYNKVVYKSAFDD